MLVYSKIDSSTANGPGNRAVLWFAGCSLGCPGCWNPDTHAFDNKKETYLSEIIDWVKGLKDVEGITFSGGEPFQQAQFLYLLCDAIRRERPDLTIGSFSGYTIKELETGKFKWKSAETGDWKAGSPELWCAIKSLLDWGVFGRYNQLVRATSDPLRGSLNQEVVFFTDKYSEKDLQPQIMEVIIDEDALTQITGFPPEKFLEEFAPSKPTTMDQLLAQHTNAKNSDDPGDNLVPV